MAVGTTPQDAFDWRVEEAAEAEVAALLDEATGLSTGLRTFAHRLSAETSTRLQDWVDHIVAPVDPMRLAAVGYQEVASGLWRHPGAQLPAVVPSSGLRTVAVRVENVEAFARLHGGGPAEGDALSSLRVTQVPLDGEVTLAAVERRSWATGVTPAPPRADDEHEALEVLHGWRGRDRLLGGVEGMRSALRLASDASRRVGADVAAALMLQVEREYWQSRNTVARIQFDRHERLGLGWGNHDHHTFRSSREHFGALLEVLHALGFADREKFHAGADAGWGAQVLEQEGAGLVVFADVDLDADELGADFSAGLPHYDTLGTVGIWCALHGDSLLGAGMHHLEDQFDFDRLRDDLAEQGIATLAPFSDYPHLRQAFTQAERWSVAPDRLAVLVRDGHLTAARADQFAEHGAPGSHLENLARRGGFKGFNQDSVSDILRRTDARRYDAADEQPARVPE